MGFGEILAKDNTIFPLIVAYAEDYVEYINECDPLSHEDANEASDSKLVVIDRLLRAEDKASDKCGDLFAAFMPKGAREALRSGSLSRPSPSKLRCVDEDDSDEPDVTDETPDDETKVQEVDDTEPRNSIAKFITLADLKKTDRKSRKSQKGDANCQTQ